MKKNLYIFNFDIMKRFIFKILILALIINFSYYLLFTFFSNYFFSNSKPIYHSQISFTDLNNLNKSLLVLGDSRVISSIKTSLLKDSRNLGLPGSSPIESYFLLKNYLSNNNTVNSIFLSYAWNDIGLIYRPEMILKRMCLLDLLTIMIIIILEKNPKSWMKSFTIL